MNLWQGYNQNTGSESDAQFPKWMQPRAGFHLPEFTCKGSPELGAHKHAADFAHTLQIGLFRSSSTS